jgi:negative regulator of flagellin synthesis FlgM
MVDGILGGKLPAAARPVGIDPARDTRVSSAAAPAPSAGAPPAGELNRSEARGLVRDLAARPPVNADKVAQLQAQIAGGRYPVDAGRIADAMIAHERGAPKAS